MGSTCKYRWSFTRSPLSMETRTGPVVGDPVLKTEFIHLLIHWVNHLLSSSYHFGLGPWFKILAASGELLKLLKSLKKILKTRPHSRSIKSESCPRVWERRVLTTGLPGNSLSLFFFLITPCSKQDLSFPTRDWTCASCRGSGEVRFLTSREVPVWVLFNALRVIPVCSRGWEPLD